MKRPFEQSPANRFDGWSREQVAQHARERIAHYSQPRPLYTDGERELLRLAWEYVARLK